MFLEYAIWGAWYPVLAARLLGPLKFSGKQTGWIYAALPLACIFMPLLAGQLADKSVNTEMILLLAHLAGFLLLFVAASKKDFKSLFTVIFLYSLCYAATLPLGELPDVLPPGQEQRRHGRVIQDLHVGPDCLGPGRLLPDGLALGLQDRRGRVGTVCSWRRSCRSSW